MQFTSALIIVSFVLTAKISCNKEDKDHWYNLARLSIERRLKDINPLIHQEVARNIIIFVGDGMGLSTITAARILSGQRQGYPGEEVELAWDQFPTVALAKTYNADAQIGESSACATALWCGVKANYETVGLDATGKFGDCISSFSSRVSSLLSWAQEQGKATGIVTTARLSHATPAALYAHSPSRYWEDDSKIPPNSRRQCKDIVRQLVEDDPGRNINVLLGGGRRHWLSINIGDPEHPDKEGRRLDGRNLIKEWLKNKEQYQQPAEYIWTKQQLQQIDSDKTDYLLGLFSYSHMDFEADRDNNTEPSLSEMTEKALEILSKSPWGYLLIVEGGRIDHAHHYNNAYRALDETLAFENAVAAAIKETDLRETLLIVTADHSHVMTLGGSGTKRGNNILSFDSKNSDIDNLPYTTLLYGNGPGYANDRHTNFGKDSIQSAAVPRNWATHGGEDVPVYSNGPLNTLFSGSFDQTYIPHAVAYIACLAHFKDRCGCEYSKCDISVENKTCNGNHCQEKPDTNIMVADQEILGQMKLISCAIRLHQYFIMYIILLIITTNYF